MATRQGISSSCLETCLQDLAIQRLWKDKYPETSLGLVSKDIMQDLATTDLVPTDLILGDPCSKILKSMDHVMIPLLNSNILSIEAV
jgi:hypothetical protein